MRYKKHFLTLTFIFVAIILFSCNSSNQKAKSKAVNPNISAEANNLLNFIYDIRGKFILSGHHNYNRSRTQFTDSVKAITGKTPLVWGNDFSFAWKDAEAAVEGRQAIVDTAIVMHKKGHIITLMWHACFPTDGDTCSGKSIWRWDDVVPQEEWDSLTTDGTYLNGMWKQQADRVAGYLKQLELAKVPVLWRPYHEMNGIWFWWCRHPGENGYAKLWRMMYNYFTNHHKLNNLIWVWNTNAPRDKENDEAYAYVDYYPGKDYVDILAADVYHNDYKQSHHDDLIKLADGKPISLGEVGKMPSPEILDNQKEWTWFMEWANWLYKANTADSVKALYNYPRTISLEDIQVDNNGNYTISK